jgi:hypothetical protein
LRGSRFNISPPHEGEIAFGVNSPRFWGVKVRPQTTNERLGLQIGCCGADGAADYIDLRKPLPAECRDTVTGNAYYYGCVEEFTFVIEEKAGWLAGLAMFLGFFQVINIRALHLHFNRPPVLRSQSFSSPHSPGQLACKFRTVKTAAEYFYVFHPSQYQSKLLDSSNAPLNIYNIKTEVNVAYFLFKKI